MVETNGTITLKEADKDQSDLLIETLNFKKQIKLHNPEKKQNKKDVLKNLYALFDGGRRVQKLQRLPIALAQVRAGNTSENLLNEIRQIIYSPYQAKEITKKVYNNIMNSIKL